MQEDTASVQGGINESIGLAVQYLMSEGAPGRASVGLRIRIHLSFLPLSFRHRLNHRFHSELGADAPHPRCGDWGVSIFGTARHRLLLPLLHLQASFPS